MAERKAFISIHEILDLKGSMRKEDSKSGQKMKILAEKNKEFLFNYSTFPWDDLRTTLCLNGPVARVTEIFLYFFLHIQSILN